MRIHSDTLTPADVRTAVDMTNALLADVRRPATRSARTLGPVTPVRVVSLTTHGSRTRAGALGVILSGDATSRINSPHYADEYAASWDQWGLFLHTLMSADTGDRSVVVPGIYASLEHFHWSTGGRFRYDTAGYGDDTPAGVTDYHRRHRWTFEGTSAGGAYSVDGCAHCSVHTRRMAYGRSWDEIAQH